MKNLGTLLRLSFRNFTRNPVRNWTVGTIIFIACLVLYSSSTLSSNSEESWGKFFSSTFLGEAQISPLEGSDLDYTTPGSSLPDKPIDPLFIAKLRALGAELSPRVKIGSVIYDYKTQNYERNASPSLLGVDLDTDLQRFKNLSLTAGSWKPSHDNGVLVWKDLADTFNWKPGSEINLFIKDVDGNYLPYTFIVDGILYQKKGASLAGTSTITLFPLIFVSRAYLNNLLGLDPDDATELAVWGLPLAKLRELAKASGYSCTTAIQSFDIMNGIVQMIQFSGGFLALFVLVILVISTINMNLMSFMDRKKELGTLIALGFKGRYINAMMMLELLFLVLIPYVLSLGSFALLSSFFPKGLAMGKLSVQFAGGELYPSLSPSIALIALAVVCLAVLLSSLYPISLTTKLNPIDAFEESEN